MKEVSVRNYPKGKEKQESKIKRKAWDLGVSLKIVRMISWDRGLKPLLAKSDGRKTDRW